MGVNRCTKDVDGCIKSVDVDTKGVKQTFYPVEIVAPLNV